MSVADVHREIAEMRLMKKIRDTYEEAQKDIDKKIEEFNRKFKVKEEAHLRDVAEGRWTQDRFDSWMKGQVFQSKQWADKKRQIERTLYNANSIAIKMVNEQRSGLFEFNANYQAYELEHGVGINFGFDLYDSATVARLIKSNPQILPMWKIDQPKDYVWNSRNVTNAVRQGIIQGERLDQIAKRLSDGLMARNMNKMLTFARTGMTEAQNSGRLTRLKEAESMGIKTHKEWMATLDERTRWQHADLDGQKRPINKPFKIDGYEIMYPCDPTAHPSMVYNCRCTLVGDLDDYPEEYERYDNIDGRPIKNMTYREWEAAKGVTYSKSPVPKLTQVSIGTAKTVEEINKLLNIGGLFARGKADLTGCDLDSAKSIAAAYEQVFTKFPQLKGQIDAPDAHPVKMGKSTYAWCYIRSGGKVQVNPDRYNNWSSIVRSYERDVRTGFHPYGTTPESIVTHEIGHAIDGLLARKGIKGGITSHGEYRFASSSMRSTIMKRAAKLDHDVNAAMMWSTDWAVESCVSRYATKDPQEWFAECFAEYITSANPRTVAREFGKELEKLMERLT